MNKVFTPVDFFEVPDKTLLCPVLNPWDVMAKDLPVDLLEDQSLAVGNIRPGVSSEIHVLPLVQQITWIISGRVAVEMKDATTSSPYRQEISARRNWDRGGSGVLTQAGTFFQLIGLDEPAYVLFIATPAYVFLTEDDRLVYDDTVLLGRDWDALADQQWQPPELADLEDIRHRRDLARRRIRELKAA